MHQKRLVIGLFFLITLSMVIAGCNGRSAQPSDRGPAQRSEGQGTLYLANNIHVQEHERQELRASYANWTNPGKGHVVIPVNTPVTIGRFSRGFSLTTQAGRTILFEFDERNMGMSDEQYIPLITSPKPVSLGRFSAIDLKGIKEGRAYVGMTKGGTRIALGYPAVHRTSSLDSNTWVYWTNRFKSIAIEFDGKGIVKRVGQ